jgi:F5/8 type C domain/Bacterial Ig domain
MWTYKTICDSSSKRAGYDDDDDDDDRKQKVRKCLFKLTGSGFCIFMLLSSVIAFSSHSLFFPTIERVAAVESPCTSLAINGLAASGDDGNVPSNTIDDNLGTRWSDHGIGSWIRGDLWEQNATSTTTICHVDIVWYDGNQGSNNFEISVSNDTNTYTTVFTGNSGVTTTSPERYDFADIEARYVKITINGNNQNDWTGISEIEINAQGDNTRIDPDSDPYHDDDTLPPSVKITSPAADSAVINVTSSQITIQGTASDNTMGSGIRLIEVEVGGNGSYIPATPKALGDWSFWTSTIDVASAGNHRIVSRATDNAGNIAWNSICVTVNIQTTDISTETLDKFRIKKIYPTKEGGEEWYLSSSPAEDCRFDPKTTLILNADGSYKVKSTQVRISVLTSTGYDQDDITTYNQKQLAEKGYMQSSNDWKNVEVSGYVKLNSGNDDSGFTWYGRGGQHTELEECEGTAYHGQIRYDGKSDFSKEQWHPGAYSFTEPLPVVDPIEGRWIGYKFVMYNFEKNGEIGVKLENWIDEKNNNTWVKVDEHIDEGGWGDEGDKCGGSPDQIISWGGPIVTFRWDDAKDVDIKHFSVREIQSPLQS